MENPPFEDVFPIENCEFPSPGGNMLGIPNISRELFEVHPLHPTGYPHLQQANGAHSSLNKETP